jgi:hypothetical protein
MRVSTRLQMSTLPQAASGTPVSHPPVTCSPVTAACVRCAYSGIPKKGSKKEFFHGYNVVAYFDQWEDRGGKHYLPSHVQKLLLEHKAEFFSV